MGARTLFLATVAAGTLWCGGALAQQQRAAAEALFRSGREAAARGDWVSACDHFSASNKLDSVPGTLLNLAKCREELGQVASAWDRYEEAAQKLPESDPRRKFALDRASALEPRLPHIILRLKSAPAGVTVEHNGSHLDVETLGVPLPVDPGTQVIVVRAPGHEAYKLEFSVGEGEQLEKELKVGAPTKQSATKVDDSSSAKPAPSPSGDGAARRNWGYASLGIGALGVGVGSVTGLLALNAMNELDDPNNCDRKTNTCYSTGMATADRGKTFATVSTVGFSVGLVGLGVGAYLLLFADEEKPTTQVAVTPIRGGATFDITGTL